MAKKQTVNKTQAVRDYLKKHPKAMSGEIAAALTKKGIKITPNYVSNIKAKINKTSKVKKSVKKTVKKPVKKTVVAETAAPVEEKPVRTGNMITVDQVKKVSQLIKNLGGYQRVTEVLDTIKELGGMRKFKELAAAISGTDTDAVPF